MIRLLQRTWGVEDSAPASRPRGANGLERTKTRVMRRVGLNARLAESANPEFQQTPSGETWRDLYKVLTIKVAEANTHDRPLLRIS